MDILSESYEKQHLEETLGFIGKREDEAAAVKADLDERVAYMLEHYNTDNEDLRLEMVVTMDLQKNKEQELAALRKAKASPYFGRVDFKADEDSHAEQIYIGRAGVYDEASNRTVVIDWRTPVASLYYDALPGRAAYESVDGKIEGEMTCKRTYSIKNSVLEAYFDADTIANDELLQAYLAKSADAVLKDIVATIQADQNEIIRIDPRADVVVQGVAGSGKTTVAMHRLAYLIFNHAGKNRASNAGYCIVGTNRMFLSYVSGMLPDLGVEGIRQMLMPELLAYLLGLNVPAPYEPEKEKDRLADSEAAVWQSSQGFFDLLEAYMLDFEDRLFLYGDMMLLDEVIMPRSETLDRLGDRSHSMADRAEVLRGILELRLSRALPKTIHRLELQSDRDIERFHAGEDTGFTHAGDIIDYRNALIAEARRQDKELRTGFQKRIRAAKERKVYLAFLKKCAADGITEAKAVSKRVKAGHDNLYDLAAQCYIASRLIPPERADEFRHLVIDEAQDFGPSLYSMLARIFPAPRTTFTVLGDVSQNLSGDAGVADWSEVMTHAFPKRKAEFRILSKSYRNTIEIAGVANTVLSHGPTREYEITPVVRHGNPVEFETFPDISGLYAAVLDEFSAHTHGSLCAVCPDADLARALYAQIPESLHAALFTADTPAAEYTGGLSVFDVRSVKGLEFDRVILAGASESDYPDTPEAVRSLYVACTRALHSLRILNTGTWSPLLDGTVPDFTESRP